MGDLSRVIPVGVLVTCFVYCLSECFFPDTALVSGLLFCAFAGAHLSISFPDRREVLHG